MLIPCPVCQRQVSEQAAFCPGCGHPLAPAGPDEPLPLAETPSAALEAADPEALTAAEVTPGAETTAGAEPAAEEPPRLSGLSPDPNPTPPHVYSDRAIDVPGSFPAALLLLTAFGLGLIERIAAAATGARSPGAVGCVTLIIAIGLLRGGSGFRTWGVLSNSFGLLIWPLLLLTGVLGPAGLGSYLGLIFNIGILLLLAGEPGRIRVRAGVSIAVLGIVASGAASALFAPPERPVASGQFAPAGTYLPAAEPNHAPQKLTLPKAVGRLSISVPSELPELKLEPPDGTPLAKGLAASCHFSGIRGNRVAGVDGYGLAPGNLCDIEAAASQFDDEKGVVVLGRTDGTRGGLPSIRVDCMITDEDGTKTFCRYEFVAAFVYYYVLYVGDPEQSFVRGEAADAFFNSVRLPAK